MSIGNVLLLPRIRRAVSGRWRRAAVAGGLLGLAALPACASMGMPGVGPCAGYLAGGAAAGTVLGVLSGDNKKERVRHGAVGAVGGAAVGYAICVAVHRQKADLDRRFAALAPANGARLDPANEVLLSDEVVENKAITLAFNLMFPTGQSQIPPASARYLDELAASLDAFPASDIRVDGHTDSVGSASVNAALSLRRANAVVAYLTTKGVDPQRLHAEGHGATAPKGDNATAYGRAVNRRVEVTILPRETPNGTPTSASL